MLKFGNIGNKELIGYFQSNQAKIIELLEGGAEVILLSRANIMEYTKE